MGKGDKPRPVDAKKWDESCLRLFSQCSTHPEYSPMHGPPEHDCIVCRRIYREYKLETAP